MSLCPTTHRFFTLACLLISVVLVRSHLVLVVNAEAPRPFPGGHLPTSVTLHFDRTPNQTNLTTGNDCVPEIIDETLFHSSVPYRIFAGALIVPITICAIFGNSLVIYVIKHYDSLRITGNVFLASLAVADVGVSTLAMTFYGLQLLQGRWIFGPFMCRLWFSCDVLFSTASIIHLACIALDRYLSIVHPFEHDRTSSERRRYVMIFCCWFVSALLSFIPIFTGIYTSSEQRLKIDCLSHVHGRCVFAVNQAYAIVSSSFSFWVPGAIMIIIYVMLIRIADKKEREAYQMMDAVAQRRRASQQNQYSVRRRSSEEPPMLETTPMNHRDHQLSKVLPSNGHSHYFRRQGKHDSLDADSNRQSSGDLHSGAFDPRQTQMKHLRRERRAVKTLGAIMVAFVLCWLPFFIRYSACEPDRCNWKLMPLIADIVFWVGYFNSMINPFLYAFHNRDFRVAFQKTLTKYFVCCRHRRRDRAGCFVLPTTSASDESKRIDMNKRKLSNHQLSKGKTSKNELQPMNTNNLSIANAALHASNGNLTSRQNSMPARDPPSSPLS